MSWSVGKVELTAFMNNSFHELIFCGWVLKTVEELFTVVEVEWIYVIVFLLNWVECELAMWHFRAFVWLVNAQNYIWRISNKFINEAF
jgi:hypothetical protein